MLPSAGPTPGPTEATLPIGTIRDLRAVANGEPGLQDPDREQPCEDPVPDTFLAPHVGALDPDRE